MSVSLFIQYCDSDKQSDIIPVATEENFREYWQPICKYLDLKLVPLFQTGLPVIREDTPFIVDELLQIKDFLFSKENSSMSADIAEHIVSRIENLLIGLKQISESPDIKEAGF